MVPERTLNSLALKKAQMICLAICLTHYVNAEMAAVGKQNYSFTVSQRGPPVPLPRARLSLSVF